VVLGAPSFALSLVSSILCCFCLPIMGDDGTERFENCMSLWGNVLTVIVCIPLAILAVLLVPFWCLLYVLYLWCVGVPERPTAAVRSDSDPAPLEDEDIILNNV
jgi:hypothetical protein